MKTNYQGREIKKVAGFFRDADHTSATIYRLGTVLYLERYKPGAVVQPDVKFPSIRAAVEFLSDASFRRID